jgi:NADPH-dependent 2,4-dienoyl-CoA reductase/sulfur reductase-like enzyme
MKLLIGGGVAGGASAAARARHLSEDANIILFERGPDVSFANCGLPYYLGGEITERDKLLVVTPERLQTRYKLDVRVRIVNVLWPASAPPERHSRPPHTSSESRPRLKPTNVT